MQEIRTTAGADALEPLREIASSHAVMAVALLGIIVLQSGKYYSERLQGRERLEELDARLQRRLRRQQQQHKSMDPSAAPVELLSESV